MKDVTHPLFLKALALVAKLEDEFLELGSALRMLQKASPSDFKKLACPTSAPLRRI
jgi:hypothetical protein